jgi:electron-transferring-flavoprotein dehydrogenase
MGLSGISKGRLNLSGPSRRPYERVPSLEAYYRGKLTPDQIAQIRAETTAAGTSMHDALMEAAGWPAIPYDAKLLISQQDALLIGGKVQAPPGYADHVVFIYPSVCEGCENKLCIEICSAEAITPGEQGGLPQFDREKCIHCGACVWNCSQPNPNDPERGVIEFRAGAGGLHSAEN